jgi:protease I
MHVRLLVTEVTMTRALKNRRVAALVTDGFEKVELTIPVAALKAAGAEVDIVSLRHGRLRGVNLHEPASRVRVTCTIDETSPDRYDALLVPGGFINPDLLRQSAAAREFVRAFDVAGKPIATLCHGPWVLASAGLLRGRTLTSWPGIRDDMVNAGAVWLDQEMVRDGNLVTSRGPQDMVPFVRAVLDHFAGADASRPAEPHASISSPQRDTPPAAVVNAMRWMPRPSIRTALGLGVAAVAALAAASRRVA